MEGTGASPFVLGVTGGIGAGKSTLCRILEEKHGLPLLDADRLGHEALHPGSTVYEALLARFGEAARGPSGAIRRAYLAEQVFRDPSARADLNGLVHPWILERITARVSALKASGYTGIVLLDAALLLDWVDRYRPDAIVLVVAARETRLERLERRGMAREEAERRMAAQDAPGGAAPAMQTAPVDVKAAIDWVVENSGTRAALIAKAEELWAAVVARSNARGA